MKSAAITLCAFLSFACLCWGEENATHLDVQTVESALSKQGQSDAVCAPGPASSGLCEDLFKYATAPGSLRDGTGKMKALTNLTDYVTQKRNEAFQRAKSLFIQILERSENKYFLKQGIVAFGLASSPECSSDDAENRKSCIESVAEGLAEISASRAFSNFDRWRKRNDQDDLRAIDWILDSGVYKEANEQILKSTRSSIVSKEMEDHVANKVFPKVKDLLISEVSSSVRDPAIKEMMIDKIRAIRFDGFNCGVAGPDQLSGMLEPDAIYDDKRNVFTYCGGLIQSGDSEFALAGVIAHELSHSIDPCFISVGPKELSFAYKSKERKAAEAEFPIKGLIACLRKEDSVGAARSPAAAAEEARSKPSSTTQPAPMPTPSYKGNTGGSPFCGNDQITESFADYMMAQILPEYMDSFQKETHALSQKQMQIGYSNVLRGINSTTELFDPRDSFNVHPIYERRINRILLVNPKIRSQMGCPRSHSKFRYCTIEQEERK